MHKGRLLTWVGSALPLNKLPPRLKVVSKASLPPFGSHSHPAAFQCGQTVRDSIYLSCLMTLLIPCPKSIEILLFFVDKNPRALKYQP
jgi:hypothetical protein